MALKWAGVVELVRDLDRACAPIRHHLVAFVLLIAGKWVSYALVQMFIFPLRH